MKASFVSLPQLQRSVTITLDPEEAVTLLAILNWAEVCKAGNTLPNAKRLVEDMWGTLGTLLANDPAYSDDRCVQAHASSLRGEECG